MSKIRALAYSIRRDLSSSFATVLCMREVKQDPLCLLILRQGRVPYNVYLETLF